MSQTLCISIGSSPSADGTRRQFDRRACRNRISRISLRRLHLCTDASTQLRPLRRLLLDRLEALLCCLILGELVSWQRCILGRRRLHDLLPVLAALATVAAHDECTDNEGEKNGATDTNADTYFCASREAGAGVAATLGCGGTGGSAFCGFCGSDGCGWFCYGLVVR